MADFPKFPPPVEDRVISLHGGTISRTAPHLLNEIQGAHIENLIITDVGARTRRNGAFALGGVEGNASSDAFAAPGGVFGYIDPTNNEFLSAVFGSNLYKSTGAGEWTQVASAASLVSNQLHQFVQSRNGGDQSLVICSCENPTDTTLGINGRSQLLVYDIVDDVSTQVSLAPACIETFQERIWYGENDTVGWSLVGELTAYSSGNTITAEPGVGGRITAIVGSRDETPNLWILKERAVLLFRPRWGNDGNILPDVTAGDALNLVTSSLRILNNNVGCIATRSAVWVPGQAQADVMFLAGDGVRALERAQDDFQTGAGFPLSYEIPTFINRINFQFAHKATGAFFDNAYHLAVPLDGAKSNTHVLRFDVRQRAWTLHSLHARDLSSQVIQDTRLFMQNVFATRDSGATDAVDFSDPSEQPHYQVYQVYRGDIDPSTSSTEPATPLIREESRAFVLQDPTRIKRWDKLQIQMSSQETSRAQVSVRLDQGQYNVVTEFLISGTANTVVLGEDALPWQGDDSQKRRFSFNLSDVKPSQEIQVRFDGVTGATEVGQITIYETRVVGHLGPDEFSNDV